MSKQMQKTTFFREFQFKNVSFTLFILCCMIVSICIYYLLSKYNQQFRTVVTSQLSIYTNVYTANKDWEQHRQKKAEDEKKAVCLVFVVRFLLLDLRFSSTTQHHWLYTMSMNWTLAFIALSSLCRYINQHKHLYI